MKFVNYGIPTGLGIKDFNKNSNSNSNKYSNLNGITNYNTENTKNKLENIQLGGFHNVSYLPCETVFYVIEHPITFEPEVENVELTDDEEISEELELNKVDSESESENESESEDKQSKLIGETETSSKSSIKSNLKNTIELMVENNKNVESKPSTKRNKIVSLKGLFSQNENDKVSRDTSYETSYASLKSILRALKDSKNTA
jgi:hypothetical protein